MRRQFIVGLALVLLNVVFAIDAKFFVGVHRYQYRADVSLRKKSSPEVRSELRGSRFRGYGDGHRDQHRADVSLQKNVRGQTRAQKQGCDFLSLCGAPTICRWAPTNVSGHPQ